MSTCSYQTDISCTPEGTCEEIIHQEGKFTLVTRSYTGSDNGEGWEPLWGDVVSTVAMTPLQVASFLSAQFENEPAGKQFDKSLTRCLVNFTSAMGYHTDRSKEG